MSPLFEEVSLVSAFFLSFFEFFTGISRVYTRQKRAWFRGCQVTQTIQYTALQSIRSGVHIMHARPLQHSVSHHRINHLVPINQEHNFVVQNSSRYIVHPGVFTRYILQKFEWFITIWFRSLVFEKILHFRVLMNKMVGFTHNWIELRFPSEWSIIPLE